MGAEVTPRVTSMKPYFEALSTKMGDAIRGSKHKFDEAKKFYLDDSWYDSIRVHGYSESANCKNCAAPLTSNGCEYCGTGKTKRTIPLSNSEKERIENQLFEAAERQLPKRYWLERIFDRLFL